MQWYVAVPLVAILLSSRDRTRRYLVAVAVAVVAIWLQVTVDATSTRTDAALLSWLQFFVVGWVICDLRQTAPWWKPSSDRWDIVAAFAAPLLVAIAGRWSLDVTLGPILIGGLLIAALHGRITSWCMRRRWLVASGRISYSTFLIHYPLFLIVRRIAGPGPSTTFAISFAYWAIVLLPLTFVVAAAFHRWIEQPCMDGRLMAWIQYRGRAVAGGTEVLPHTGHRSDASPIAEPSTVP
jgi:peptidoglycan/LPS O-acetylase OafA/YrhL